MRKKLPAPHNDTHDQSKVAQTKDLMERLCPDEPFGHTEEYESLVAANRALKAADKDIERLEEFIDILREENDTLREENDALSKKVKRLEKYALGTSYTHTEAGMRVVGRIIAIQMKGTQRLRWVECPLTSKIVDEHEFKRIASRHIHSCIQEQKVREAEKYKHSVETQKDRGPAWEKAGLRSYPTIAALLRRHWSHRR